MRAPLSIVIPTLNAEAELAGCLAVLVEGLGAGLVREVVVSDGGSNDDTVALARAAGAEIVEGPRGRGGQIVRGAEAAKGEWLMFLHADTVLDDGWSQVVLRHIGQGGDQAGYFGLKFRDGGAPGRFVAGWANIRSRVFGLPFGDQGLLISRALYDRVGGYQPIALMEDVAMARALKGQLCHLDCWAETSPTRFQTDGWIRRGARNWALLFRYLVGGDPDALARAYQQSEKRTD